MSPRQSTRHSTHKRRLSDFVVSDNDSSDGEGPYTESVLNSPSRSSFPQQKSRHTKAAKSTAQSYRQPEIEIIAQVKTNKTWKHCEEYVKGIAWGARHQSDEARRHAELSYYELVSDEAIWGKIMEDKQPGPVGGPCAGCAKRKIDCVVMLEEVGGNSGTGSPYRVASHCIQCTSHKSKCDIGLSPQISKRPKRRTSPPCDTDLQLVQATKNLTTYPQAVWNCTLINLSYPPNAKPRPEAEKNQARDALNDIAEFIHTMRTKVSQGGTLDFQTKSMFMMVEQQVQVLRGFVDQS